MQPNRFLNRAKYLNSIAAELSSQANRVRYLIGKRHWFSDGHFKEYLLTELLRRHLPASTIAARGFVVSRDDPADVSTEQDILVLDALQEAPLFNQGGLVIAFPETVLAAISIKTTFTSSTLTNLLKGLSTVRNVCRDDLNGRPIWCGGFFFRLGKTVKTDPKKVLSYLASKSTELRAQSPLLMTPHHHSHNYPDALCCRTGLLYLLDHNVSDTGAMELVARAFDCERLAAAVFLSQLIDHVAFCRGETNAAFNRMPNTTDLKAVAPPKVIVSTPKPVA